MVLHQTLNVVNFFKGLSENMLELFLKRKGLELDIETLKSANGQQYWEDSVDEDKRNECRLDCGEIAALSSENGLIFIAEAIEFSSLSKEKKEAVEQSIEEFETFQDKAVWMYVNHKELLDRAGKFCFIDEIRDTAWKRRKGFDVRKPSTDSDSLEFFSRCLADHFHKKLKKGRHCVTEFIKRADTYLYFAHQEDTAVRENQFNKDQMAPVTRKPEYLLVFAFSPQKGMLEIWGERLGRSVTNLYSIFAKTLLNLEKLPPESADGNYDLQKVMTQRLQFTLTRAPTLRSLSLTEIQLVNREDSRRYISIKSVRNEDALYEEFDERVPREIRSQYLVNALRFTAVFDSPKINGRSKRFSLKSPNECTLGLDNDAEELKKVLSDSGLEFKKEDV
ncbi:hypothetical protein [uncultured Parasutterella sp.]|uniref:hypothetical protein n=1 Tax=uncultured Parasutterella sp. TaxID=1263098 RepID=UPI002613479E|nr:hypothetical protein [uncultured Parasutterella sp.]